MKYTLISSERSPFGRICRMLMINGGIDFNFRVLNIVDSKEDAAALAKETPINKVPILEINGSQKIFDSRVIANYLIKNHGLRQLSLDEENIVSAIYSCIDVSVILFLMKLNGYDLNADNAYLRRQLERLPANLDYVKSWALQLNPQNPTDWNYASMSLFSYLYWAKMRAAAAAPIDQRSFQNFMEGFADAPGVLATSFK